MLMKKVKEKQDTMNVFTVSKNFQLPQNLKDIKVLFPKMKKSKHI